MYIKKGMTGILSIMLAFSTMFSDVITLHAEEAEPVETAVTETVEKPAEHAEQTEETVEEAEQTAEPTEEVLPEEAEEAVEETEETPEPEQEQTEEETTLPAEETAEPETTEVPAEETADTEETEEPAVQYEVTFDAGDGHFEDGSTLLTVTAEEGTFLTEVPEVFSDEELELVGWFAEGNGEPVDFTVFEVTESVTLTAVWAEKSIVAADNTETEITVDAGAYSAAVKFSADSYLSTLYFVYSTDSTDTLLTDLDTVTWSDLNKKEYFSQIDYDRDYNSTTEKYDYVYYVHEKNNKPLKPNTTYYVQIYQYSSGNYVKLGNKFDFTTTAGIEQTDVEIKNIQVQDGYTKSHVTFNLDNPNNEDILETRLFVTQPDGTETSTTYYAYYNSSEKCYYADFNNKWETGYSVRIGVKVPVGDGEIERVESEPLVFNPKDPSEITSNISTEEYVNSAVIKAEISPYYSWDSLNPYVYYRKKGETNYKSQSGYYSTYTDKPTTATVTLKISNQTSNTSITRSISTIKMAPRSSEVTEVPVTR